MTVTEPVHVGALATQMAAQLERIREKARTSSRVTDGAVYRCPRCHDTGWIEVDAAGRGTVEACRGPMATQCPAVAHKIEQARAKGASDRPARGGERSRL